jgi:MULE transposase-like protein
MNLEQAQAASNIDNTNRDTSPSPLSPTLNQYVYKNPDVMLFDCTYKTKKCGMPLLDVIGFDGRHQIFAVGVSFLDLETEPDYG